MKLKAETYEGAKELLEKEVEEFRKAGISKELIAQYYEARLREIETKHKEELEKDLEEMAGYYEEFNKQVEERFEKIWNSASSVIDSIVNTMRDGLVEMIDQGNITAENFEQIWERIKRSFINAITAMVAEFVAKMAVISAISVVTGLPLGTIAGRMGVGGKGLFGLIGLQEGGIVRKPTIAVIGEKEPEAVIPLSKMNTGHSINLTINAFDLRNISQQQIERFARQIRNILNRELKK